MFALRAALCHVPHTYAAHSPGETGREGVKSKRERKLKRGNEEIEQVMEETNGDMEKKRCRRRADVEVKKTETLRWSEQTLDWDRK